jgi:hypothetical protein
MRNIYSTVGGYYCLHVISLEMYVVKEKVRNHTKRYLTYSKNTPQVHYFFFVSSRSITFKNVVLGPLSLFGLHRGSKSACNHEAIRRACPLWLRTWLTAPCWDRLGGSFAIRPLAVSLPLIPLHTQLSNRPCGPSRRGAERRTIVENGGRGRRPPKGRRVTRKMVAEKAIAG